MSVSVHWWGQCQLAPCVCQSSDGVTNPWRFRCWWAVLRHSRSGILCSERDKAGHDFSHIRLQREPHRLVQTSTEGFTYEKTATPNFLWTHLLSFRLFLHLSPACKEVGDLADEEMGGRSTWDSTGKTTSHFLTWSGKYRFVGIKANGTDWASSLRNGSTVATATTTGRD